MSACETWALYRQALDTSMDGMVLLDFAGRQVYTSAAHLTTPRGFRRAEDLIRQSWRILYDEQLHAINEQVFPRPAQSGQMARSGDRRQDDAPDRRADHLKRYLGIY